MMTRTMPIDRSVCSLKLLSTRDVKSAMFGEEFLLLEVLMQDIWIAMIYLTKKQEES